MGHAYRRFILIFALPVALLLPAGLANLAFLDNTGELADIDEVAAIQQEAGGLYGTALHPNVYAYKLALLAARKPDIVAIGSSRVLQFRQAHFTHPFANLGRTVNYPAEAVKLVGDMLTRHKPEVVLFGIDHYWLNPAFTTARDFSTHPIRGGNLSPDALVTPWRWLADGRVSWDTYRAFVVGEIPSAPGGAPLIGVRAILDGAGFAADGSWHYDHIVFGRRPPEDPRFSDTLRRIETGRAQFRPGTEVDRQRVAELRAAIGMLEEAGVAVVTFVPPMAQPVLAAMAARGDAFAYAAPARAEIAMLGRHHLDLLDASVTGARDCEFVDGFHIGDVGAARLLDELARNTGHPLAAMVDRSAIADIVSRRAGAALAETRFQRPGEREEDFLAIGCKKPG
ncbi:MAG: hypothetical protein JJ899_02895 [Alphaproteobacteria bacterium]|nr:hypothetical protein [Alphaproteobacteria bacterium]